MRLAEPADFIVFQQQLDAGRGTTQTVVFFAGDRLEADVVAARLRDHHLTHAPPERVVLLAAEPFAAELSELVEDSALAGTLPGTTRYVGPPDLVPITFGHGGKLSDLKGKYGDCVTEEARRRLVRTGVMDIFDRHQGMLPAGPAFHYVNPSGQHTRAFIRAANVLLHSAEIAFLAFGLLEWWPKEVRRVYTDSATINSVAHAVLDLSRILGGQTRTASIDSFSSYQGLSTYQFDEEDAACLISASISGNLHRDVVAASGIPPARVVTLFYCGAEVLEDQPVLCDVTGREGQHGYDVIEHYKNETVCDLCRRGLSMIRITGDQFLLANPTVRPLLLTRDDEPRWLSVFLERMIGANVVRCHGDHASGGDRPRELYLHLPAALDEKEHPFTVAARTRLLSAVPAALRCVIHLDDPSSARLTELVLEHYAAHGGDASRLHVLSEREAYDRAPSLDLRSCAVFVVAGAAATGRGLLGVSRLLRQVGGVGQISYLVGVARMTDEAAWDSLRSNLTFGDEPAQYPLVAVARGFLPESPHVEGSPWTTERNFLDRLERLGVEDGALDDDARETIERRRNLIRAAAGADALGFVDDLFLPPVTDGRLDVGGTARLALQRGFVFWSSLDRGLHPEPEKRATQAEVYLTVACILHGLRQPGKRSLRLVEHEHNRTVLGPGNFARFNDGVIQAALLRAARPSELDYTHDAALSGEMSDIIERLVERRDEREGEAAPEFLLALARGRLRLAPTLEKELHERLSALKLPGLLGALVWWLGSRHRAR
jgi:hypothetical protein